MGPPSNSVPHPHLGSATRRLAQQILVICENRIELFLVEIQEEREQIMRALWLSLVAAVFALLAGVAASIAIAVACWQWSPLAALLILAAIYTVGAGIAFWKVDHIRREWRTLPSTLDELRKDRECLEKNLK